MKLKLINMNSITAIVLTKNEEKNIEECLMSIKDFVSRVVVMDCYSTDNTVKIAKDNGADVFYREYDYYAKQFNWAIDNANIDTDWILRLDADERFTPELCEEVERIIDYSEINEINGITMEANLFFLNKCMRYGLANKRKMMLFKTGIGRIEDRKRDAHSVISVGKSAYTRHRFLHYDFKNLSSYIERYNWYATKEMEDYLAFKEGLAVTIRTDERIKKQRAKKFGLYYKMPKFHRAFFWFFYNYICKGGFRGGKESLVFHFLECFWYRFLVDAKILEYEVEHFKNLVNK